MGTTTLTPECPLDHDLLKGDFPDDLLLLKHPSKDKWACNTHEGITGVAAFTNESSAIYFRGFVDVPVEIVEASFEEAREIAKGRPMPVVSVMLLDNMDDPKIHYVK